MVVVSVVLTIAFCLSLTKYLLKHNQERLQHSNAKTEEILLEHLAEEFQKKNELDDGTNLDLEGNPM
jgi:hypothetical protein